TAVATASQVASPASRAVVPEPTLGPSEDGHSASPLSSSLIASQATHSDLSTTLASIDGQSNTDAEIHPERISIEELNQLWRLGEPVVILDVRTDRSRRGSDLQARGAVHLPPDHVAERVTELGLSREAWLVAYCA
ncbi:MAG: hypothetical protein L0Y56_14170, partial [Nitrospira sp.]|nr:hypothetical protein [Nitrospira sp.]